ncbi:MAG: ATP-binding protein [Lentisphaeria bacterium]|nr:ATP-binding protein [Lentisphaeria bacterium]
MKYIERNLESVLKEKMFGGKALVVYGPRQSGKTTMIRHLTAEYEKESILWLNGDNPDVRAQISGISTDGWRLLLGERRILVVDEAQHIEGIGMALKLVTDEMPEVQVIATGSSAFELRNRMAEPLTGRKFEYRLPPLSFGELASANGILEEKLKRERRLLFGSYPDVVAHPGNEPALLSEIAESYLFKDIFALDGLRKTGNLDRLVRALAFQIGSEVSLNELAGIAGMDVKTVDRYIELLARCYIVHPLGAFSRNLRNEIKKGVKVYFCDLGIRNAVISNFSPLASRTDAGPMWENYLIMERVKLNINRPFPPRPFFWRTRAPESREIDYLEESDGHLRAWEIKSNPRTKTKFPLAFQRAYPNTPTAVITPFNYETFLLPES